MAEKSKMSCNKPVKSDRAGKKKMVKACSNGTEKLIHFGASGYGHNYSAAARKSFKARHKCREATNKLTANTGLVKIYGAEKAVALSQVQKELKVNIKKKQNGKNN
jgi:hypothetical protein